MTALACRELGRQFIGVDLNPEYVKLAVRRLQDAPIGLPMFQEEE